MYEIEIYEWFKIEGDFKYDYYINKQGQIRFYFVSKQKGPYSKTPNRYKYIKPTVYKRPSNNGYKLVSLAIDKYKSKQFYLHRLLAQTFVPNPEHKQTVNHKDGNTLNNSIDNLEWCTQKENIRHAWSSGLCDHRIIVDDTMRLSIKRLKEKKWKLKDIAERFGISENYIHAIIKQIKTA